LVRINSIAGKPAVFGRFDAAQAVLMRRRHNPRQAGLD